MSDPVLMYVYDYFYIYSFESKRSRLEPTPYFLVNVLNLPLELGLIASEVIADDDYTVFFSEFFLINEGFFNL